jgi:hypothetical protein
MSSAIITASNAGVRGTYDVRHNNDVVEAVRFDDAMAIARLVTKGAHLFDAERDVLDAGWDFEGPCCSICDGLGHGYVGGAPCPLEMRGEECPDWAQ